MAARGDGPDERVLDPALVDATATARREHRMRASVAVIAGWALTLDEQWGELTEAQRREGAQAIRRRADELMDDATRLLAASRADGNGAPASAWDPVSVSAILVEVADAWNGVSPAHPVRVGGRVAMWARAEPQALRQVLDHLVANAIRFSPAGGPVGLRARHDGAWAVVEVQDHGAGIPADVNVFAPQHDGDPARLCLRRARDVVEHMGGSLQARRDHLGGSTFLVRLQRALPALPPRRGQPASSSWPGGSRPAKASSGPS